MTKRKQQSDHAILMALACGATIENAAIKAGVGPGTVNRRLKNPEFAKKLQDVKAGMVNRTAAILTAAASESVKTLLELQSPNAPPGIRLGAARAIIELGARLRDAAEIQGRIAALEQQLSGEAPPPPPFIPPPPESPTPETSDGSPVTSGPIVEAAA
jgi:hypothetical protein